MRLKGGCGFLSVSFRPLVRACALAALIAGSMWGNRGNKAGRGGDKMKRQNACPER